MARRIPVLPVLPFHRLVAALVAAVVISASIPARAEHDVFLGPPDSTEAKVKSGVVLGLLGGSVLSIGTSLIFLAQASSASNDAADAVQRAGGAGDGQCRTRAQCDAARPFRQDQADAIDRGTVAVVLGGGLAVVGAATMLLWRFPNAPSSPRVAPSVGPTGAGLCMEASF